MRYISLLWSSCLFHSMSNSGLDAISVLAHIKSIDADLREPYLGNLLNWSWESYSGIQSAPKTTRRDKNAAIACESFWGKFFPVFRTCFSPFTNENRSNTFSYNSSKLLSPRCSIGSLLFMVRRSLRFWPGPKYRTQQRIIQWYATVRLGLLEVDEMCALLALSGSYRSSQFRFYRSSRKVEKQGNNVPRKIAILLKNSRL